MEQKYTVHGINCVLHRWLSVWTLLSKEEEASVAAESVPPLAIDRQTHAGPILVTVEWDGFTRKEHHI